jgi:ribosome-binding protein aMBF1 (putative translation factor)
MDTPAAQARVTMRKEPDHQKALIAVIEWAMEHRGVSERALCKRLGEHKNYINEIVHEQHRVTVPEFIKISEALDISPLELLARILRP